MKVAFIGSHGVGKTTLCFELAGRLKRMDYNVDIVKEVARDCPLPINRETNLDAQLWILHSQCAREIMATARFELVVCDRSVIDNYAYLVHSEGRREDLHAWLQTWLKTYSYFIKVPIWSPPRFDGTRDTGTDFQQAIDDTLESLMKQFALPCLRLKKRHQKRWIDQVIHYLELPAPPVQLDLFT